MAKRALIVDDSRSMRQMIAFTLASAGFETRESENGLEGLGALKDGPFDIVITDVNMPVMDGFEFVRQARASGAARVTPILLLTTESSDEKKAEGRAAGATGWIVKPFQPDVLLAVVNKVVAA